MTSRILLDPDGSAILVEPGSYLLWEPEFPIGVPADHVMHVFPAPGALDVPGREGIHVGAQPRVFSVAARAGIWVPPRPPGVTP